MEAFIACLMILAAIILIVLVNRAAILPGLYWALAVSGFVLFFLLDALLSTRLAPSAPWAAWVLWGIFFGGAIGLWTVAPSSRLKEHRPLILLIPVVLLILVCFASAFVR